MESLWCLVLVGGLLGHDHFDVREQTTAALVQAPALVSQVLAALADDPEIRWRAQGVVDRQWWPTGWLEILPPPVEECDP